MDSLHQASCFSGYQPCGIFYSLFIDKLKEENSWTQNYAELAVSEYVKFLIIVKTFGVKQTPSRVVDEVWHMHLQFTKDYWENLCPNILGFNLHHVPTLKDKESNEKNLNQYQVTLQNYRTLFGDPPEKFWGDRQKNSVKAEDCTKKVNWKNLTFQASCCLVILLSIGSPAFSFLSNISGQEFLLIYGLLLVLFNLAVILMKKISDLNAQKSNYITIVPIGYMALLVFGLLRIFHGISNAYPVSFLFCEVLFGAVIPPLLIFSRSSSSNDRSGSCSSCSSSSNDSGGSSDGGGGCGGCGGD